MTRRRLVVLCLLSGAVLYSADTKLGLFEANTDIGETPKKGSATFDSSSGEYQVTGGGANIWKDVDAFQFAWKKMSGDLAITADVHFVGVGAMQHRKAAVMIRQSLEPGSAYADVALHGDGLTSLQFRPTASAMTQEVRSDLKAPVRIRIERRGDQFMLLAGNPGEELKATGPATVALQDPVYVGLAVGSHDANVLETAVFSNVKIEPLSKQTGSTPAAQRPPARSKVSIFNLKDKSTQVIYTADNIFEAPNWSPDGKYLMVNSGGNLYRLPLDTPGAEPQKIDLGPVTGCNNDHGISPDGKLIAISARGSSPGSKVYLASSDGSKPHLMTPKSPSYYHGWSPDGKWLAFTGQRDGNFDIYRIATAGGEEERLTFSPGYDDGPDYSPDGKWIYVNSDRTGQFQVWRFPADGAGPNDAKAEQVTTDEYENWFPHPSPDGKWMTLISFEKGTKGHPANQNIQLRIMPLPGAQLKPASIQTLTKLFGGQGTINVNSWSPDSQRFAFVSYELLTPEARTELKE